MAEQVRRRVLVVGGGVAGVAAAARLAQAGIAVTLLEQARRLGGRAASGTLPGFGEVDLGVHVLMRTCRAARALLRLLGAEGDVRFQPRLEVPIWHAGRVHWVESHPLFHLTPFFFRFGHIPARERLALLRLLRGLAHVPEASAADWLQALKIPPRAVELLLRPLLLSALNGEPGEVSARYAAMVIRRVLLSPRGGALGFFQVPMSRIWERVVPLVERAGGE
ncbi:MAG: FAD-dependent oxidoreductase, partial [Firmicutes bacterium]|nr:FAD-dependent oxidoreductase [Bacillota bacterium]